MKHTCSVDRRKPMGKKIAKIDKKLLNEMWEEAFAYKKCIELPPQPELPDEPIVVPVEATMFYKKIGETGYHIADSYKCNTRFVAEAIFEFLHDEETKNNEFKLLWELGEITFKASHTKVEILEELLDIDRYLINS